MRKTGDGAALLHPLFFSEAQFLLRLISGMIDGDGRRSSAELGNCGTRISHFARSCCHLQK